MDASAPSSLSSHKAALAALLLLCALAGAYKLHLGTTPNSDYDSYQATAQLFSGLPAALYPQRVLKPLAPLFVAAVAPLTGFPDAFLFETVFFYFAFALAFYWLAWIFFTDKRLALFAALLGALSYPMLRYGVDLYTETGAQFFYILSLALTLLYIRAPSRKLLIANGLALGIGLLWKEYSVVAGLILGLVLLFGRVEWRSKFANLALLAFVSLLPTVLVQIWVYTVFHYSYFNWYAASSATGFATQFTLHNLVKSFAALLGLAWLAVPLGMPKFKQLAPAEQRFLLIALPVPFIALLWGYVSSRLFFVMAPAFILLAVLGLARAPRWAQYAGIALTLAINLVWLTLAVHGASV